MTGSKAAIRTGCRGSKGKTPAEMHPMSPVPQCHQQHAGEVRQESVVVGDNGGLAT
jgi:hypothetical protein